MNKGRREVRFRKNLGTFSFGKQACNVRDTTGRLSPHASPREARPDSVKASPNWVKASLDWIKASPDFPPRPLSPVPNPQSPVPQSPVPCPLSPAPPVPPVPMSPVPRPPSPARLIVHDGALRPREPVEQRRLAHVGPPYDGDAGQLLVRDFAPLAACLAAALSLHQDTLAFFVVFFADGPLVILVNVVFVVIVMVGVEVVVVVVDAVSEGGGCLALLLTACLFRLLLALLFFVSSRARVESSEWRHVGLDRERVRGPSLKL